jgi:hypothetical protein
MEIHTMTPGDLELFTTSELIEELVRRTTFLGVVVHSPDPTRQPWKQGERTFRVHYNSNLDQDEAGRLLSVISDQMDRNCA